MKEKKAQPQYLGHRERLRKRLLESEGKGFADYELLELLLTIAIPRKDVKPLAKTLLKRFSTFTNVINATPDELKTVSGIGETTICVLKIIQASIKRTLHCKIEKESVISNWNDLLNYCTINIGNTTTEEFHILYLNAKCGLIKDECHSTGTIDNSTVYPREILKHILENGATSIIMAHNHPTGDPTPSDQDIKITKKMSDVLKTINVPIYDHIIIGKGKFFSFKSFGLL